MPKKDSIYCALLQIATKCDETIAIRRIIRYNGITIKAAGSLKPRKEKSMTNEVRRFTDKQIVEVFARTKKTANVKVHDIEYLHREQFPDIYKVNTDNGAYYYQKTFKYNWKSGRSIQEYDRIVKAR